MTQMHALDLDQWKMQNQVAYEKIEQSLHGESLFWTLLFVLCRTHLTWLFCPSRSVGSTARYSTSVTNCLSRQLNTVQWKRSVCQSDGQSIVFNITSWNRSLPSTWSPGIGQVVGICGIEVWLRYSKGEVIVQEAARCIVWTQAVVYFQPGTFTLFAIMCWDPQMFSDKKHLRGAEICVHYWKGKLK